MRYTKYDYRKKNKNKGRVIFPFLIIISLGVVLGIIVFKIFFIGGNSIFNNINSEEAISKEEGEKLQLVAIQCGLYEKKENAESALLTIPSSNTKFIIEEDGKFKVMAGIFTMEELDEKRSELEKNSINNFVLKFKFTEDSIDSKIQGEIINGYLKIINKSFNEDIKNINTQEFKIWVEDVSSKSVNKSEEIITLLEKINLLPEEYQKENGQEDILYLYNIITKYKI